MRLGTMLLLVLVPLLLLIALLIGAWRSGPRSAKRNAVYLAYLLAGLVVASCFVYYATLLPVAADEKTDPTSMASWGYRLQRYRFRDRYRLDIWHDQKHSRLQISYEGSARWKTPEVVEQRWLATGRAIYLNLHLRIGSIPQERTPARMIYDFDLGQLYLFSPYWLWRRHPEFQGSRERWLSEQEFDEVLKNLEQEN